MTKDCENCKLQPGCQRYGAMARQYVGSTWNYSEEHPTMISPMRLLTTAEIAADCKHFEDIHIETDTDAPEYIGAGLYDFSTPTLVKKETDHRERGCSNCKHFEGFGERWRPTQNPYIYKLISYVLCNSDDSNIYDACPDSGCEHHEFR